MAKAIDIEAVSDLTTESFLATLGLFNFRRGFPKNFNSYNRSNSVGADLE